MSLPGDRFGSMSVAAAAFDADGRQDLVLNDGRREELGVTILFDPLGAGGGDPMRIVPGTSLYSGDQVLNVHACDMNADGIPDLVLTIPSSGTLRVVRGLGGRRRNFRVARCGTRGARE